jgi:thiamine biosynthesis lipoprotein
MAQPVPISEDLFQVLNLSQRLSEQTDGAFDVTIGPYVQLWRRSRRQEQLPTPERLAEAKAAVGWKKLRLIGSAKPHSRPALDNLPQEPHQVQLLEAKMRLDLGGIAMGYISDRVLAVLREQGIQSALCDLSGDLAIGSPPPDRKGWRVAIQSLAEPNKAVEYLELSNCGVSTSGDTYRFVEIGGVRYSHIVDAKTGLGLTHRIGVTVIAPTGMTADVLATTVSALGAENGLEFVEKVSKSDPFRDAAVRITEVESGAVNATVSEGYKRLQ